MNISVGRPEIGQWYTHLDKGGMFQVVGRDDDTRTIEVQSYDGDVDEIDAEEWATLPIERCEAPEDWTAPMDDAGPPDAADSDVGVASADPVQPIIGLEGRWQEVSREE